MSGIRNIIDRQTLLAQLICEGYFIVNHIVIYREQRKPWQLNTVDRKVGRVVTRAFILGISNMVFCVNKHWSSKLTGIASC